MTLTPGHVPCRYCGKSISWSDWCWTHDLSGFAECGTTRTGGDEVTELCGVKAPPGKVFIVNPEVKNNGDKRCAEPIGDWE